MHLCISILTVITPILPDITTINVNYQSPTPRNAIQEASGISSNDSLASPHQLTILHWARGTSIHT